MGFWIFMLLSDGLIPGIMIFFGWWFRNHPPKNINCIYGYRTRMSKQNQDTWNFAHQTCGKLWLRWGKWTILTLIPMFFVIGQSEDIVGMVSLAVMLIQMIPLLGSIWPVEKALKETFDENGNRKK